MNSLNNDSASLNQAKYRPIDVPNQYYQQNLFYRLPNNTNITPEFASLQSAYGANQLLATQFSFQYSDNQGLGEGLTVGNNGGPWATGGASQSRAAGSLDPNHFYSLPSHGPAQTADQSLFYPYGFSATNNVYWQHPSVLEYKSTGQNFALPATEKPQTWPDSLVNGQYSPLGNTLTYKSNIPLLDHNNQALNANNTQSNFDVQLGSNGYHIGQVAGKGLAEEALSATEDRTSHRKSDNNTSNQDMVYTSSNNPNEINHELISLEAHLVKNCSLHNDNNNGSNISQHPYSVPSFSKQSLNNNAVADYWSNDVNKLTNYNAAKSYAKAAKLSSRSVTQLSNSNSSSYYMDNGYNNGSRSNYKSQTNGFATGFVRPSNVNNNWGNNPPSNGPSWNTSKSKWNQDISRGQLGHVVPDTSKSSWPSKSSIPNSDEHLRNAEYRIKEIQTQINPKRLDINFEKTRYFVIKSYSEDDVHRSIKYKIWCSTKEGNRRLNEAFQGAQKNGGSILLFFSVNGSGHFCGVAEMISSVDESVVTGVWCQDKWRGKFSVKWLFVKDVPNTQLRHITTKVKIQKGNGETTNEIKPITNLRDATELKSDRSPGSTFKDDIGYQALKIIMECKSTMSIFDDFLHYEKRELGIDSAN